MADKAIGELPKATSLQDDSLLVMEQQGTAQSVTGSLVKSYAVEAAKVQADAAKSSADAAAKSRDEAAEKAQDAADVALHPPKIQNGNWWTWDTAKNAYVDSGVDAGVSLTIGTVTTGAPGSSAKVTNRGTPTDPILDFTIPRGDTGPVSSVNGQTGDVQVMPAPVKFTVSLPASGWVNNAQTVRHAALLADDKYKYLVNCAGADIYADNVTVAGQMTFHADIVPAGDLTLEIIRLEVAV